MKLAELCETSPSYIGEIEIGRKFPSIVMIEKIAFMLKIEPYRLFKNRFEKHNYSEHENAFPLLPKSMKAEIKRKINLSVSEIFKIY